MIKLSRTADGRYQSWRNANGQLHRTDGPDIVDFDGSWAWYINGKIHRNNGPAYTGTNGTQMWYINGERHRTDGPAVIYANGTQYWYVNGTQITSNKEFQRAAKLTDEEMTLIILKYGNVK